MAPEANFLLLSVVDSLWVRQKKCVDNEYTNIELELQSEF